MSSCTPLSSGPLVATSGDLMRWASCSQFWATGSIDVVPRRASAVRQIVAVFTGLFLPLVIDKRNTLNFDQCLTWQFCYGYRRASWCMLPKIAGIDSIHALKIIHLREKNCGFDDTCQRCPSTLEYSLKVLQCAMCLCLNVAPNHLTRRWIKIGR